MGESFNLPGQGGPGQSYRRNRRSKFIITGPRLAAARALASGFTIDQAARFAGVANSTVDNWLNRPEFNAVLQAYAKDFVEEFWARMPESSLDPNDPNTANIKAILEEAAAIPNKAAGVPAPASIKYGPNRSRGTRELSKSFNKELRADYFAKKA